MRRTGMRCDQMDLAELNQAQAQAC